MEISADSIKSGPFTTSKFVKKLLAQVGAFVSLVIVCVALIVLYRMLHEINLADVEQHIRSSSGLSILELSTSFILGVFRLPPNHVGT